MQEAPDTSWVFCCYPENVRLELVNFTAVAKSVDSTDVSPAIWTFVVAEAVVGVLQRSVSCTPRLDPATGLRSAAKNSGSSFFPIAQTMIDNSATRSCATGYQAAGFVRMN
jgi:hypothetical protein